MSRTEEDRIMTQEELNSFIEIMADEKLEAKVNELSKSLVLLNKRLLKLALMVSNLEETISPKGKHGKT